MYRPASAFSATTLCCALLALTPVSHLSAQDGPTDEWMIASAVLAAPPQFRENAEVRKWVGTELVTIREGDTVICIADRPDGEGFRASCYSDALEPFMVRGRELREQGISGMEYQETRWADVDAGRVEVPTKVAMVFNLSFACEDFDPATADPATGGRLHAAYTPYTTPEMSGLPISPQASEPWLMWPGKAGSHIMIAIPAAEGDAVCGG